MPTPRALWVEEEAASYKLQPEKKRDDRRNKGEAATVIEKKTSQSSKKSTVLVVERPSKENEVEAGPTLERLDAVEEGCVVRDRLGDDVEHGGGLDLHLLGSPPPPGAKAHPLLPQAVLHDERLEATCLLDGCTKKQLASMQSNIVASTALTRQRGHTGLLL